MDSTTQVFSLNTPTTYFLPNAFTPNGDGKNETFIGIGWIENILSFQLRIYDRWGKLVFATTNPNIGWNGHYQNTGNPLPAGVYTYQGVIQFNNRQPENLNGSLVLVR